MDAYSMFLFDVNLNVNLHLFHLSFGCFKPELSIIYMSRIRELENLTLGNELARIKRRFLPAKTFLQFLIIQCLPALKNSQILKILI